MRWLTAVALLAPVGASSQLARQPVQTEVRVDGLFARTSALHAGYGVTIPAGVYVRTGIVAGAGASSHGAEGRVDGLARFSLDPFRQSRWAPYAGAGISGRFRPERAGGTRGYLLVFLGLEGPLPIGRTAGWVPALELGLGGGTRVGIVLRKGIVARR